MLPSQRSAQRPSFHGQTASATSMTTSNGSPYERCESARGRSTTRSHSASPTLFATTARASASMCGSGSSIGASFHVTVRVRSRPSRKLQIAAWASGSVLTTSRTMTSPVGSPVSKRGLTANSA